MVDSTQQVLIDPPALDFAIWVVTGIAVGCLVFLGERRRGGARQQSLTTMSIIGVIGAIVSGLLWFRGLGGLAEKGRPAWIFFTNVAASNIFAATFGAALIHWAREALAKPTKRLW